MKNNKGIINTIIIILIISFMGMMLFPNFLDENSITSTKRKEITYTQFTKDIQKKKVNKVYYTNSSEDSNYYSVDAEYVNGNKVKLISPIQTKTIENLISQNAQVVFKKSQDYLGNMFSSIISMVVVTGLLIAGMSWFFKRGTMSMGSPMGDAAKSSAKKYDNNKKNKVMFSDVSGYDEEKFELQEFSDFLKDSKKYKDMGATIPKGVLLSGPPGTGKTMLARAVAGEAGVPFFSIAGSEFMQMFVGAGASKVRDLFEKAKKEAPSIIFIDEIDSIGKKRGMTLSDGREEIINQLLVNMDGFENDTGVIVMAATNRDDILDPALTRPGRFDRKIQVNLPDYKSRKKILEYYVAKTKVEENVDIDHFAKSTFGFSGAELKNIVNEAAILAVRDNRKKILSSDMDEALDRTILGPAKKSKKVSATEKTTIAFHEAGHALLGVVNSKSEFVQKVTIVPRGNAGGFALHNKKEDRGINTYDELVESIVGILGGRAAEKIVLNQKSSGASNDIMQATNIARSMVYELGMSKLGPIQFFDRNNPNSQKIYSDETNYVLDKEVSKIIFDAEEQAINILENYSQELNDLAQALLDKETLNATEILEVLNVDEDGVKIKN